MIVVPVGELQTRLAELANIRGFLTGSLLTLALDAVFSIIYVAVMVVYSGVLTAVTLGAFHFSALTFIASPAIKSQLRKAAEKMLPPKALRWSNRSMVFKRSRLKMLKTRARMALQRSYSSFMSESFRSLLTDITTGTTGQFLSQLSGLITLGLVHFW